MKKHIVSWDLGATKCLAGLVEWDTETNHFTCLQKANARLADADSLNTLVMQLENLLNIKMREADAICIGAAGYFDGATLYHDNAYPYAMAFNEIADAHQWPEYTIIHDYASLICATFTNYMETPDNVIYLNNAPIEKHSRRITFGIGTGLGLKDGVLLPDGNFWFGHNEMGHIGVPTPPLASDAMRQQHHAFMVFLRTYAESEPNPSVTFEKILSGNGLSRLYAFLHPNADTLSPEAVGERLHRGQEPELMAMLAWYLGLFVGTVELSFMPAGGIWLSGGVLLNHPTIVEQKTFTDGIQASPAYMTQRQHYPLGIMRNPEHALIGCAFYASKRLLSQEMAATAPRSASAY